MAVQAKVNNVTAVGGFMKLFRTGILISSLLLTPLFLHAQDEKKGETKETVGPMTEPVIRARLKALGYSNIRITHTNTLRYQISATKNGKPAVLQFHPQTGEVREITVGKPAKVWTMPVEPASASKKPNVSEPHR
jgi:hypothetical protein